MQLAYQVLTSPHLLTDHFSELFKIPYFRIAPILVFPFIPSFALQCIQYRNRYGAVPADSCVSPSSPFSDCPFLQLNQFFSSILQFFTLLFGVLQSIFSFPNFFISFILLCLFFSFIFYLFPTFSIFFCLLAESPYGCVYSTYTVYSTLCVPFLSPLP